MVVVGNGIEELNLDFDEERTDGKAVVEIPQLINVLEAILFYFILFYFIFSKSKKSVMNLGEEK
jgi:hypothetical protein